MKPSERVVYVTLACFAHNDSGLAYPSIKKIRELTGCKKAEAYKWLEKAIDSGWMRYAWSSKDPLLENFHNDDRFKKMMAKVKNMVDEMRRRVEKEL